MAYSEIFFWCAFASAGLLLYEILVPLLDAGYSRQKASALALSQAIYLSALALFFFSFRWQWMFCNEQLNIDEGSFLVAAESIRKIPGLWLRIDLVTSGMPNLIPMTFALGLGLEPDYITAHIVAFALQLMIVYSIYSACRPLFGESAARLAVLQPVCFYSLACEFDFLHCSSELFPSLLIMLALLSLISAYSEAKNARAWLLGAAGFLLSLAVLSKIQSVPVVLMACAVCLISVCMNRDKVSLTRAVLIFIGGLLIFPALYSAALASQGLFGDFTVNNFSRNIGYVMGGSHAINTFTLFFSIVAFKALCVGSFIIAAAGIAALLFVRRRKRLTIWEMPSMCLAAAVLLCLGSLIAVLTPGRLFAHYLNFLIFPLALFNGALLNLLLKSVPGLRSMTEKSNPAPGGTGKYLNLCTFSLEGIISMSFMLAIVLPFITLLCFNSDQLPIRKDFNPETLKMPGSPVAACIRSMTEPGQKMLVWGWMPCYHLQTKMLLGTRETMTYYAISQGPLQDYYRRRLLDDVRKTAPEVFVDDVCQFNIVFSSPKDRHESFKELADYIAQNYRLAGVFDGRRVYIRAASSGTMK